MSGENQFAKTQQKPHRQKKQMRNKGIWGGGLRVGECEVARTYIHINLLHIQNTHIPLHICKPYPGLHIYSQAHIFAFACNT
jgi:hypothetical protein